MSANTTPIFVLTPNCKPIVLTAANTASDGSGSPTLLLTAGANGSRVDAVTFTNAQATQAASSAMRGVVFLSDTSGANYRIVKEILIAAATRSATVLGATSTITFSPPLVIQSGQLLGCCISVRASAADDTVVTPYGGDF